MNDPIEKFAEEIAKKLPVERIYDDGLSSATSQVGLFLTDVAKTMRLALAPFQLTAALQDRLEKFIDNSVRRVPLEHRISPAPQILGPVIEGIRYEPDGTEIEEMFSELLSRAMDKDRLGEAHPSFPIIIKQLSSDEAKILAVLRTRTFTYIYSRHFDGKDGLPGAKVTVSDAFPIELLQYPSMHRFYVDHLQALNLVRLPEVAVPGSIHDVGGKHVGAIYTCEYQLTDFGQSFVGACIGKDHD